MNDIGSDNVDEIVNFLKDNKGNIKLNTLRYALVNWSSGEYDKIKRPYKLTAHFVTSCMNEYMEHARLARMAKQSDDYLHEYVPSNRSITMNSLKEYATQTSTPWISIYSFLMSNKKTDIMNSTQIIQEYEQRMER
jgi:hypothetical protein